MPRLTLLLSALLCSPVLHPAMAADAPREFGSAFFTGLSISVVQVRVADAAGKSYFGSGVVVAENEVVTNCHVTRHATRLEVAKGALVFPVFGQRADMDNDLCLLRTTPMPLRVVALRDSASVKPGERSFFYGYPGGIEAFFAPGRISTRHPHGGSAIFETSSGFTLGGSGGGLFDEQGRLIGITTFLNAGHRGGYFAMPADRVGALRSLPERDIGPLTGLALWEKPDAEQPWFLRVARLTAQSRWQQAADTALAWTRAEPENADAWHQAGAALVRGARYRDAIAPLQRALAGMPDHPDVLFHMALALSRSGSVEQASEMRVKLASADAELAGRLADLLDSQER